MRLYDAWRRARSRPWGVLAAAVAIATIAPLAASAQSPTIQEFASDAATSIVVNDFATHGSAAAGARTVFSGGRNVQQATRWNEAGGLTNLIDLGAHPDGRREGFAYAISGDGSVTVGSSVDWEGSENKGTFAVRWDPSGATAEKLNSMESASNGRPFAIASFVSGNGTRVAGRASRYNGNGGPFLGTDAILWTGLSAQPLTNHGGVDSSNWRNADVTGISGDGGIVAGYWNKYAANKAPLGIRPVKWTPDGAATELPTLGISSGGIANAKIHALSKNGKLVFGYSEKYDATGLSLGQVPVYWDIAEVIPAVHVIHEIVVPGTNGTVLFCSESGAAACGTYVASGGSSRGFYWTLAGGAVDLGTLRPSGTGQCVPRDFSLDGRTIVGFATPDDTFGGAFIRQDGVMSSLWKHLRDRHQLDPAAFGWKQLDEALFCSADGSKIFGRGTKTVGGSAFFRVTLPSNAPPTIESSLVAGQVYDVPLGSTFTATFTGRDQDGDDLALQASGLPASAVLTPSAGTVSPAPTTATLTFAPVEANVGDHPATITFRDEANEAASISFTLRVPTNAIPTVTAPAPIVVECAGEQNLVTLSTIVDDADAGHLLTVSWSVGGQLVQTDVDVVPGSTVEFEFDYPHGESIVTVDVTDGYDQATASSAVRVQDTTRPTIILGADIVVPTDPGKNFATVVLPLPQVFDLCDEEPTLTNDAPEVCPVGETLVTWTAVDEFLNVTTVTQLVTVEDREAPMIVGAGDVTVPVDQGEIFATVDLPEPEAFDNVTVDVAIESDAPATFSVGERLVTWTATDEAGNQATWSLTVTVVNQAPVADAGDAVSVEASSSAGVTVTLDGTGSFDDDGHELLYSWSAPGITFDDPTSPTPSASFPVGETHVTLVVTDEANASDSAETVVAVVYDPVQSVIETRTYGPAASAFVAQSRAAIASLVAREPRNAFLAAALQAANQAAAYDAAAASIEFEDASDYPAALQMYRVLRARQAQASAAVATAVLLGRLISRPNGASDAEFAAAFQAATNATLYGLADATQP